MNRRGRTFCFPVPGGTAWSWRLEQWRGGKYFSRKAARRSMRRFKRDLELAEIEAERGQS